MPITLTQTTGLIAMLGAAVYAIGDVLLLAARANLADYPNLQPHAKLLSGAEKMVVLPWWRLMWGGLLGVFATPLLVIGLWPLYYGLAPAGVWAVWPVVLLLGAGFIMAPFVHGTFVFLGEYVQALNTLSGEAQTVVTQMLVRFRSLLMISYGAVMVAILGASLWFSASVWLGATRFPQWMAAVNPLTAFGVWLVLRRIVPPLGDWLAGAGFNIAFLLFFAAVTTALGHG
jgi:hypothetical protein